MMGLNNEINNEMSIRQINLTDEKYALMLVISDPN